MPYRSPPTGCRALAVFSLLIGLSALLVAVVRGNLIGFLVAPVYLAAAYGLWSGVYWGWYVGMVAFSLDGLYSLWELRTNPGPGLVSVAFAMIAIAYIYRQDHHYEV